VCVTLCVSVAIAFVEGDFGLGRLMHGVVRLYRPIVLGLESLEPGGA
jgi:hypothetical protein